MSLEHAPRGPQVQMPELPKIPLPKRVEGGWSIREWFKKHPRLRNAIAIASGVAVLGGVGVGVKSAVENRTEESNPSQTNITATLTTNEASGNGGTVPTTEGGIVVVVPPETSTTTEYKEAKEVLLESEKIDITRYNDLTKLPEGVRASIESKTKLNDASQILEMSMKTNGALNQYYLVKTEGQLFTVYNDNGEYACDKYVIVVDSLSKRVDSAAIYYLSVDKDEIFNLVKLGSPYNVSDYVSESVFIAETTDEIKEVMRNQEAFDTALKENVDYVEIVNPGNTGERIKIEDPDLAQRILGIMNPSYDKFQIQKQQAIEQKPVLSVDYLKNLETQMSIEEIKAHTEIPSFKKITEPINVSEATQNEFQSLPGIGDAKVLYETENGDILTSLKFNIAGNPVEYSADGFGGVAFKENSDIYDGTFCYGVFKFKEVVKIDDRNFYMVCEDPVRKQTVIVRPLLDKKYQNDCTLQIWDKRKIVQTKSSGQNSINNLIEKTADFDLSSVLKENDAVCIFFPMVRLQEGDKRQNLIDEQTGAIYCNEIWVPAGSDSRVEELKNSLAISN